MDPSGQTRRSFLVGTSLLGFASMSGCASLSTDSTSEEPKFVRSFQESVDQQPLKDVPATTEGASTQAAVFSSKKELRQRIKWSVLNEPIRHNLQSTDFSTHVIATLIADPQLVSPTTNNSWCPNSKIDQNKFIFQIPLKQWPSQKAIGNPTSLIARFEKWKTSEKNAPSKAIAELEFLSPGEQRTCSD